VTGNVIADMQSEMEEIKRRLEAVESELKRLREGLRDEQGGAMTPGGGVAS
jgi:hypothetical protein